MLELPALKPVPEPPLPLFLLTEPVSLQWSAVLVITLISDLPGCAQGFLRALHSAVSPGKAWVSLECLDGTWSAACKACTLPTALSLHLRPFLR